MGNPSDGFHGKTIAVSIANFWAEVSIVESERLVCKSPRFVTDLCMFQQVLVPHPLNDPNSFGSLEDLHGISRTEG